MTQYKLISREPTDEMLRAIDEMDDYSHVVGFQALFDAAPHIETEAEKEAEFFLNILMKEGSIGELYDEIDVYEALSHIRALLAERGIK